METAENTSRPFSQTGVGGAIGTTNDPVPPPGGQTFARNAFGSHDPLTCSPTPGTSGENLAVATAYFPGASKTRIAARAPGCAGQI